MKIKNVEISAFRIYDDPKDSTFDFIDQKGETANFVSLYAPNGFGKTSFYDAVEWGVTKSINRFYIRSKELEKLADFQAIQNKTPLVRNAKSSNPTYVKVTSDTGIFKEDFKKHGKQLHDINFKKPVVHDFQQVMLSQEWISAFLTESDGETRYKKFMEKPDLISINNYYNNLKLQLGVLKDEKDKLLQRINDLKNEIISTDQEDLLTTVNAQIQLLTSEFQQQGLSFIQLSTTKEEIKKMQDIISGNRISANKEISINNVLEDIVLAKSGNESLSGLNLYFEYKSIFDVAVKSIVEIETNLKGLDNLEKSRNELVELKQTLAVAIGQRDNCTEIIRLFEDYKHYDELLKSKEAEKSSLEKEIAVVRNLIETNAREETQIRSQFDSTIVRLEIVNTQLGSIPALKESIQSTKNEIEVTEGLIKKDGLELTALEKEIGLLSKAVENIKQAIAKLDSNEFSPESVGLNTELIELISRLSQKSKALLLEKGNLAALEEKINEQKELNSTIQKFVESGLAIANQRQDASCPLCEHVYDSYAQLAEKISNNAALNALLKQLFHDQSSMIAIITGYEEDIKRDKDTLKEFYSLDIAETQGKRAVRQKQYDKTKENIDELEAKLKLLQTRQTTNSLTTGGAAVEAYEASLTAQRDGLEKSKSSLEEKLNKITLEAVKHKDALAGLLRRIELNEKETLELISNSNYLKIIEWFKANFPSSEITDTLVLQKKEGLIKQIGTLMARQASLDAYIAENSEILSSFTKEGLGMQLAELEKKRKEAQQKIEGYSNFLSEKLQLNMGQLSQPEVLQAIEDKESHYKEEFEQNRRMLDEYSKLLVYSENISSFLQSENAKKTVVELQTELDNLEDMIEPVIFDEKNKTKSFLQQKIQEFFYETLINDLYRKIDPHPEFREVKFQADFESESPRLDVFVKSKGDETLLIPNLYFSTAQINILSLSIFLATALNSPKYQCIFIDDPIQSMDSINVLSTVDLFRSIVVNHNKQIILSTHDENFHNLLQKKMPPELFSSKFLELESFGKLKSVKQ